MNKSQARKLKKRLLAFRKALNLVEISCWKAQRRILKRDGEIAAYTAHDDIGYAVNRIRDELETAADNIQYEVGCLPTKSK